MCANSECLHSTLYMCLAIKIHLQTANEGSSIEREDDERLVLGGRDPREGEVCSLVGVV